MSKQGRRDFMRWWRDQPQGRMHDGWLLYVTFTREQVRRGATGRYVPRGSHSPAIVTTFDSPGFRSIRAAFELPHGSKRPALLGPGEVVLARTEGHGGSE